MSTSLDLSNHQWAMSGPHEQGRWQLECLGCPEVLMHAIPEDRVGTGILDDAQAQHHRRLQQLATQPAASHDRCFCGPNAAREHCHGCSDRHGQSISADYCRLQQMKASPPAGWFNFGTHIDRDGSLEFWGEEFAEDGLPIWERPI